MFSRFSAFLVLAASCGLAGCSTPPPASNAKAASPVTVTEIKGLFPKLEKGMSVAVVREKLGAPAEIQPMKAPEGKAEVWVYHFEKTVDTTQVATSTIDVPTFSTGTSGPITVGTPEPVYSMADVRAVVTLSLLMVNDQLTAQKAKVEHRLNYN